MVIGKKFVWAHLPKAAGDSTVKMFHIINNGDLLIDPKNEPKKHDSYWRREQDNKIDLTNGRDRILNIRRLPKYLISNRLFYYDRYGNGFTREDLMNCIIQLSNSPKLQLDEYFKKMSENVKHWMRTENLADDFISVIGDYYPFTEEQKEEIKRLPPDNVNEGASRGMSNKMPLDFWFTKKDIASIYEKCPYWASVEEKVYGSLLI